MAAQIEKKSASKGIAWRGKTACAAASSTASVAVRGSSCLDGDGGERRRLQGLAIEFAGDQARQFRHHLEMAGDHVAGKLGLERVAPGR